MTSSASVPQPPTRPIVGNLFDLDVSAPVQSMMKLAETYGPFFRLRVVDQVFHLVSSQELVDELSDESRFTKRVDVSLENLRPIARDGLFTAYTEEPNWGKAHRILMPALGPIGVRSMFDEMQDIANQMFLRWERFGPEVGIDVADNMTRLTLDTIALCGFNYRFNSFYQNELHPFVGAMTGALTEAGQRAMRPEFLTALMFTKSNRFRKDAETLHSVAQKIVADRKGDPDAAKRNDLLSRMLNMADPETGDKLSEENVAYQMVTLLIAGHETTSGLLSFATYLLLRNPEVLQKARAIVDDVLGDEVPRIEHLAQLRYIEQLLMESLRLWPTAAAYSVKPLKDTTLGGRYPLTTDDTVMVLAPSLHRDPKAWHEPEAFLPERFAPENADKLLANAWKPFGNGQRACIGRSFAMQEAHLVLSMMLQRFDFSFEDPSYKLKIHESLTLKPENLRIKARIRRPADQLVRATTSAATSGALTSESSPVTADDGSLTQLKILYGSNAGSAEALANRIAAEAGAHGFAPTLAPMDRFADDIPRNEALIIVTASYEGQPPDNARQFLPALESCAADSLPDLRFAVFGCGNRQWARTWQAIPKRVDAALEKAGAQRIIDRGEGDSGGDFFGSFDEWSAGMWPALAAAFGKEPVSTEAAPSLELEFVKGARETALRLGDLRQGVIVENRELVDMSSQEARSKRHIELKLPVGMTYRAGDYLAVLPRNSDDLVDRALRRFGLASDVMVTINSQSASRGLPAGHPISCGDLLSNYVELSTPATKAQVRALATSTKCPPEQAELQLLATESYDEEVLSRRLSVLDLLERFASCPLGFAEWLQMLPPMTIRQYSISSSPLWNPEHVTLTIAVLDAPALSGMGRYQGVASSYMASRAPGDRVSIAVRPSNARFHPPMDLATPIVLICAGSGIAPFRGFLQERSIQKSDGKKVGPALLFFGVDHPDVDFLYRDELAAWERDGVVTVLPAFSAQPEGDVTFVQHRVWSERARIAKLFQEGATVFVCGDGKQMAPAVRDTLIKTYREASGASEDEAHVWADVIEREQGRYVSDVFS
jgi:cytochrome P450/NADPH-cytochrome P450 reductase